MKGLIYADPSLLVSTLIQDANTERALQLVRQHGIRIAVLKSGSPSCGNALTYDGTFSGVKVRGEGVTAALLKRHGVQVFSELELAEAAAALQT